MPKSIKIIREIKKNIKVKEINKDEEEDQEDSDEQENRQETLEDIATEAPSSRQFFQFNQQIIPQQLENIPKNKNEWETEVEKKEEKEKNAPVYQVHDVSEAQLRKAYESERSPQIIPTERTSLLQPREQQNASFKNQELEQLRRGMEDDASENYKIDIKTKKQSQTRKMPWE